MNIEITSRKEIFSYLKGRQYAFVAAISFEDRCTHISHELGKNDVIPSRTILIDYLTEADPSYLDKKLRSDHRNQFLDFLESRGSVVSSEEIKPYSTSVLRKHIASILRGDDREVVIDISCMTRAHILSLAGILANAENHEQEIYFCYTAAESYNVGKEAESGWCDVLLLPVGYPRSLRREGHARGVVLPGHDAERLCLALSELEPAAGCVVYSNTDGRPDLMRHAQEVNAYVSKYLLSLRMPELTSKNRSSETTGWKDVFINLDDFVQLEQFINEQVKEASRDKGPMVLFPFGPKTLVLSAGLILASLKEINAWAIYPVPYKYHIDYSQRSARTYWMKIQE